LKAQVWKNKCTIKVEDIVIKHVDVVLIAIVISVLRRDIGTDPIVLIVQRNINTDPIAITVQRAIRKVIKEGMCITKKALIIQRRM
jgi:hypothetical protein